MAFAAGSRLAQYEIVSAVGSGGMGVVYRARDTRLGRDVALKVMAPHIAADPVMRGRFETEARAVASLSHPCIMSIFELAVFEGVPFAVMELLEGRDLRERMAAGPLPWAEGVEIAAAIADGLAAAHAKGVVHRDLKPENVFLTRDGQVKILDFGIALQRLDAPADSEGPTVVRTAQGVVLGTFGYMSPEQITGARVDGRADVFALGCLIFEMLAGRRLFTGGTPQEVLAKIVHQTAADLPVFDSLAPQELRAITARCIERDPARRFESAEGLAGALRALLSGSAARTLRPSRPRGKSLAVLPFVNTAGPDMDYLSDGITESIINTLSQLEGVRVIPRSLAFRYKGLQADPSTVGMALNVRTLLTGRVSRHADVLSVQAELVDTGTQAQLWGEQYRQGLDGLLTVQEEIAWQISEALRLKLTSAQKKKMRKRPTVHPEAHRAYLRGRHHWGQWSPEGFRKAVECFQEAIDLDPLYAAAYAGLGDACGSMAFYGQIDPRDGFARATAAARRALELDRDLPDAHVTLALGRLFADWNWAEAGRELDQAVAMNPKLAMAHAIRGLFLSASGRAGEALAAATTARQLDPLSLVTNMSVAWAHHFAADPEAAAHEALKARELAPSLEAAGNVLIRSYEKLGRFDEAIGLIAEQRCWGLRLDPGQLRAALRSGGAGAYWRKRLTLMHATGAIAPPSRFAFAVVHLELGEPDLALDHLEQLVDARAGNAVFIGVDDTLRRLRGHSRYDALLRRVGAPMASAPHTAPT